MTETVLFRVSFSDPSFALRNPVNKCFCVLAEPGRNTGFLPGSALPVCAQEYLIKIVAHNSFSTWTSSLFVKEASSNKPSE